jgi:IS4 transposase
LQKKYNIGKNTEIKLIGQPNFVINFYYEIISNSLESSAEEIAFMDKKRWGIEILFKKMKQNFQLYYSYGENENVIHTQVWCMLIAQLLMTVV